jgi:hypothetical protein
MIELLDLTVRTLVFAKVRGKTPRKTQTTKLYFKKDVLFILFLCMINTPLEET